MSEIFRIKTSTGDLRLYRSDLRGRRENRQPVHTKTQYFAAGSVRRTTTIWNFGRFQLQWDRASWR